MTAYRVWRRRRLPLLLGLALAASGSATAQAGDDEDADLQALLQVLDQETELVTRTRLNSDFVPGVVTVLDGELLADLGVRTVWEALMLVPGVSPEIDPRGTLTTTVRGIYFPFDAGAIQILLNGFPVGREDSGLNGSALTLPISQVERVEFIRGPGSVLYGDYAFQGLLNVVTRKQGRGAQVEVDDDSGRGAQVLFGGALGDWQLSANLAARTTDQAVLPLPQVANEDRASAIVTANHGGLSLQLAGFDRSQDPIRAPAESHFDETAWHAALRWDHPFSEQLATRLQMLYLDTDIETNTLFRGHQWRGSFDVDFSGWQHQRWLAGVELNRAWTDHTVYTPAAPPGTPPMPVVVDDRLRRVDSLYLQDQIELSDALRATLGVRWDDNSDIGRRLTPRAALVWQPSEHHLLKLQYAEGYRAPTVFELYTDGMQPNDLDFEVNASSELSYIYRQPGSTLRATLFRSRITDMVFRDPIRRRFDNVANANSTGVELEWRQRIGNDLQLLGSWTRALSEDQRNAALQLQDIASNPSWYGSFGLRWQPLRQLTAGLTWQHVDQRDALPDDNGFDRIDLSLSSGPLGRTGIGVRLGVDNLLDQHTPQLLNAPFGTVAFDFQDRVTWLQLGWWP